MKIIFGIFLASSILISTGEAYVPVKTNPEILLENGSSKDFETVLNENAQFFLSLTPKSYKESTGKNLKLKEIIQLKAAQKTLKAKLNNNEDKFPKGGYIVLVIFGLGFIPLGILSDWKGNDWWINLLLSVLCWLPGVIHGLVKMNSYYK